MLEFLTGEARFCGWVFGKEISGTHTYLAKIFAQSVTTGEGRII
jgi:hypothetical protein